MRDRLIELLGLRLPIIAINEMGGYDTIGERAIRRSSREKLADHLLANGVTVKEWISVNDRLPEEDGYYLVFVQGYYAKCVRTLNFAKDGRKVDEFDFDEDAKNVWYRYDSEYGYVTVEDVTHWMPLPQPPKGE